MLLAPRLGAARRAAHAPGGGAGRPLLPRGPPPAPRRPSLQCHGRPRKLTPAEQDAADVAAAEAAAFEAEARGGGGEEGEEAEGGPQEDEEEEEELVRVYALRCAPRPARGPPRRLRRRRRRPFASARPADAAAPAPPARPRQAAAGPRAWPRRRVRCGDLPGRG